MMKTFAHVKTHGSFARFVFGDYFGLTTHYSTSAEGLQDIWSYSLFNKDVLDYITAHLDLEVY